MLVAQLDLQTDERLVNYKGEQMDTTKDTMKESLMEYLMDYCLVVKLARYWAG